MKKSSSQKILDVTDLLQQGYFCRAIESITGLSKAAVSKINKTIDGNKENKKRGRPSKLSPADQRRIANRITSGQLDNAVQATQFINNLISHPVHPQTVRNSLKKSDFKAVIKAKKPLLTAAHRKHRLYIAEKYRNYTVEDWKRVIWSDETKINRFGSDGHQYVWKKKGEPLSDRTTTPTVKFGGRNLMVWECMGWNGVGVLAEVEGRMDAKQYVDILEENLDKSRKKLKVEKKKAIFRQDNDPKHTSNLAQKWFKDQKTYLMEWPAQYPDLNPIEHLWNILKCKLNKYKEPPKGSCELWDRVAEEWNKITPEDCQNLIENLPRRLEAVYKAKGGHTKY